MTLIEYTDNMGNPDLFALGYLRCRSCGGVFSLLEMTKNKSNVKYGGYETRCKSCNKQQSNKYYHAHREVCLEKQAQYRESLTDEALEHRRQADKTYREHNAVRLKERAHQYYLNNKEHILARVSRWCALNPDKTKLYKWRYARANPAKIREMRRLYKKQNWLLNRLYVHRRRLALKSRAGSTTPEDLEAKLKFQNGLCVYCGSPVSLRSGHIDHVVPVTRDWEGEHCAPGNLQILCPTCNMRKGNKTHQEYLEYCAKMQELDVSYCVRPVALALCSGAYAL